MILNDFSLNLHKVCITEGHLAKVTEVDPVNHND